MSMFRDAVHEIVQTGLRSITHPVQGYIPAGGINKDLNLCTVRIPNPHGGVHPTSHGNYIEFKGVPLPFFYTGFIGGLVDLVQRGDRGVVVGFKGANMANPYIVSPLSTPLNTDKKDQTVDDRKPVAKDRLVSPGGSHQLVSNLNDDGGLAAPDTTQRSILKIKSFSDLLGPGEAHAAVPDSLSVDKLSVFQSGQQSLIGMIDSTLFRDATPAIVPKR